MAYKPYRSSSSSQSYRHAEAYADQQYSRPLNHAKRSDLAAVEEYQAKYVPINPDSDAPDPEAMTPSKDDKNPE